MGDDLLALGVDAALEQRGELGDGHERLAQVVRGDVGEALELGVRAAQLGLVALAGGDVVDDGRGADDLAAAVAQRRRGEHDVEQRAVLAHPLRLDALDALAGEHAAEARVLALEVLVAHERPHVLADDLLARVAQQTDRAGIPVRDVPLAVGAHDRVVGRLDDRGHQLGCVLGAAQVGHVAVRDEDAVAQLHGAHLEHPGDARAADEAVELDLLCQGAPVSTTCGRPRTGRVAEGRHEVQQPVVDDLVDPIPLMRSSAALA